jgi:maltose alpha-D-glucosyltransferase/alpha-amylase
LARVLRDRKVRAKRIRCHGYYHLRQVLFTGNDFAVIDFGGEPRRRLSERRLKNSPLRDVATMLHSLQYAASSHLLSRVPNVVVGHDEFAWLQPAAVFWHSWVSAVFLKSYLEVAGKSSLLPQSQQELSLLLRAFLLDRAVAQLNDELESRPEWLRVPLEALVRLLRTST